MTLMVVIIIPEENTNAPEEECHEMQINTRNDCSSRLYEFRGTSRKSHIIRMYNPRSKTEIRRHNGVCDLCSGKQGIPLFDKKKSSFIHVVFEPPLKQVGRYRGKLRGHLKDTDERALDQERVTKPERLLSIRRCIERHALKGHQGPMRATQ